MDRPPAFRFVTHWRIEAPRGDVWPLIADAETWPHWWRGCLQARRVDRIGPNSPVRRYRFLWRGVLPHELAVDLTILDEQPPRRIAGVVAGELVGTSVWSLDEQPPITTVRFELAVDAATRWVRYLTPVTRPLFHWNHQRLMAQGRLGLDAQLGAQTRAQR